jgi:hypothetical protein
MVRAAPRPQKRGTATPGTWPIDNILGGLGEGGVGEGAFGEDFNRRGAAFSDRRLRNRARMRSTPRVVRPEGLPLELLFEDG